MCYLYQSPGAPREDARESVFTQQEGLGAKAIQNKMIWGHVVCPKLGYSNMDFPTQNVLANVKVFYPRRRILKVHTFLFFSEKRGGQPNGKCYALLQ